VNDICQFSKKKASAGKWCKKIIRFITADKADCFAASGWHESYLVDNDYVV
jgi:hypothetical protein